MTSMQLSVLKEVVEVDDVEKEEEEESFSSLPSLASIKYHLHSYHHYEGISTAHLHRGVLYRLYFDIISLEKFDEWGSKFIQMEEEYRVMLSEGSNHLINDEYREQSDVSEERAANITADKSNSNRSSRVFNIHNDPIKRQLILKDLQRLFINGLDNGYFQTKQRQSILQNVLCLWTSQNLSLGYKQGMHEIASVLLLVIENEYVAMNEYLENSDFITPPPPIHSPKDDSYVFVDPNWFQRSHIEMNTFWLFSQVMKSLNILYNSSSISDKAPVENEYGIGVQHTLSSFLSYVQGVVLKMLHPKLWEHFQICGIDAQLYGTSWTRLLFGRIFHCNDAEQLAIWDYLFSVPILSFPKEPYLRQNIPLGPYRSPHFSVDEGGSGEACRVNQFGLTDMNRDIDEDDFDSLALRQSSAGWYLGKHLMKAITTRGKHGRGRANFSNENGSDSDSETISYQGQMRDSSNTERLSNQADEQIREVNLTDTRMTGSTVSSDEVDKTPSSEDILERNMIACSEEEEAKQREREELWRDSGPVGESDVDDSDHFCEGSAPGSREVSDDIGAPVLWPFPGQDVLLKVASVCIAIIFKIRDTLLWSSELNTIASLLRPFEKARASSVGGCLEEVVFEVIRLAQQFESFISSGCTLQPIPLQAVSDIMDYHNIRSATYSLEKIGAPTWRDASMSVRLGRATSKEESEKGWYLGKYLGKIAFGRNKNTITNDFESVDRSMKKKRELLKDYYSQHASSLAFSIEFSGLSELPLQMGWLRKRGPRGNVMNAWKRRYVVLTKDCLSYYVDDSFEVKRGQIYLTTETKATVEDGTKEKHRIKFAVQDPSQKVRFFLVETEEVRKRWIGAINRAVLYLQHAYDEEFLDPNKTTESDKTRSQLIGHSDTTRDNGDSDDDDDDDEAFEFNVATSFCRNVLVGDDLQKYHYASGWLKKKSLIGGKWRLLFFELVKDEILYYSETNNVAAKTPLGRLKITPAMTVLNRSVGKTKHKFAISTSSAGAKKTVFPNMFSGNSVNHSDHEGTRKIIYCAARNEAEKEQWMAVLKDAIFATSEACKNDACS